MALLLVPLFSLVAIWAFAAWMTSRGVFGLFDVQQVTDKIAYPVEDTAEALSKERLAALVYLADPRRADAGPDLRTAEQNTDQAVTVMRDHSADRSIRSKLDATSLQRLDVLVKQAGDLDTLRRQVDENQITRADAFTAYNDAIDPYYTFFLGLDPLQSVDLDRQARVLTELDRARELISREDALYAAALVSGRMSRPEQREFSDAVAEQRTIYATYPDLLPASDAALFDTYWKSGTGLALHNAEEQIITADADRAPTAVTPAIWQSTASSVLGDLSDLDRQAYDHYNKRVEPFAVHIVLAAGIAGGAGLLAVLASVVISLRIGRSLARDLSALRREAQEASGSRLPSVIRRLAAGDVVDVETEVPRLEYPDDEIGQVGRALNTLQRAAVEAAVRQADMRKGVSDVFVNLARRSQVLLHRQLTLLDAMERRTEAGEELADLFRLDHMTTRMRRHAEGLVILSGAAPSRQWRKPIPLMDVVRAAVAEVEDYERVEVRRLPRLSVSGAAVADLTHLLAELIENATVFSPPHTTVHVHGQRVANGFVLEIDDRGLGMTPDALLDANLRLAETPEFELSDTDRLGLFVVSRLAQRQDVRVSLRHSPYGGTTAVVLVPAALLTDGGGQEPPDTGEQPATGVLARLTAERLVGDGSDAADAPDGEPGADAMRMAPGDLVGAAENDPDDAFRAWGILPALPQGAGEREPRPGPYPEPVPRPRPFEFAEQHQQAPDEASPDAGPAQPSPPDDGPAPLPRRRRGTPVLVADGGRTVDTTRRHRTEGAAAASPSDQTSEGLPRRVRQASLAPQLRCEDPGRDGAPQGPGEPATAPAPAHDRDADEVRARMSSLQRGWQRGRAETDDTRTADRPDGGPGEQCSIEQGPIEQQQGTTSEGDGR